MPDSNCLSGSVQLTLRWPLKSFGNVHVIDYVCANTVAAPLNLHKQTRTGYKCRGGVPGQSNSFGDAQLGEPTLATSLGIL